MRQRATRKQSHLSQESGHRGLWSYAFGLRAVRTLLGSFALVVVAFVNAYYHVTRVLVSTPAGQRGGSFFSQFSCSPCLRQELFVDRVTFEAERGLRLFDRPAWKPHAQTVYHGAVRDKTNPVQQFTLRNS